MRATMRATAAVLISVSTAFAQDAGKSAPTKSNAVVPPAAPTVEKKEAPIALPPANQADAKPVVTPALDANSLSQADVRDWRGLAKRLEVMGEADLLPTSAVWKNLSTEAKAAAKRISKASDPAAADRKLVIDALNVWIAGTNSAADAAIKAGNVRDAEAHALLKKPLPTAVESRRLHRLLVEGMFPFEVTQQPSVIAMTEGNRPEGNVSAYPPNRPQEVTLKLSVPRLKGRLNVFLPNEEALTFRGDAPVTIKAPNTGAFRYALTGDGYETPFSRTITWNPDEDVKNGVVERTLSLKSGRRE
jgi:hypothetical protein